MNLSTEESDYKKYIQSLKDSIVPLEYKIDPIENLQVFSKNPKLLQRLKLDIQNNSYYEAHQLYKTIHFR
jgi:hypothetical protein